MCPRTYWSPHIHLRNHSFLVYQSDTRGKCDFLDIQFSVFDFGCVVWGNATNVNLTRLVKFQKRAARMILKADFMSPSEKFFKELNWLPFPKRVHCHTCLIVYKSITEQAPEYISSMLWTPCEANQVNSSRFIAHSQITFSLLWQGIFSSRSKIME